MPRRVSVFALTSMFPPFSLMLFPSHFFLLLPCFGRTTSLVALTYDSSFLISFFTTQTKQYMTKMDIQIPNMCWFQWFHSNFLKLREYFLCTKKLHSTIYFLPCLYGSHHYASIKCFRLSLTCAKHRLFPLKHCFSLNTLCITFSM